ncbi:tripeptidyl-peptidase I [Ceratobasidium sp. AG-Ba]|nr:tripeptidyl-peptidase I [Ceratobasidium sp. AG-Ba]
MSRELMSVRSTSSGKSHVQTAFHASTPATGVPRGWRFHSKAPAAYPLKLRIALPQPNFAKLERELYEHLSPEEVNALVAPHPNSLSSVDEWLGSHGFEPSTLERSPARDWVTIVLPVSKAEEMLATEYGIWEHAETGEKIVRTTEYSVPEALHAHIHLITPTTMFGALAGTKRRSTMKATQKARALYNTGNYTASVKSNRLGIAGYLEEFANFADLQTFYKNITPRLLAPTLRSSLLTEVSILKILRRLVGASARLNWMFSTLVYQLSCSNIYYTTAGRPPHINTTGTPDNNSEPYLEFLQYLLAKPKAEVPQTISTSYGDEEQSVPKEYAKRICGMFAQLVGDGRAANSTTCVSVDTKKPMFLPAFPASCPYVTAVGGTHYVPEVAVGFSGGGFSDYFDRPIYQAIDVPLYLKKLGGAYKGLYNPTGRAYPDFLLKDLVSVSSSVGLITPSAEHLLLLPPLPELLRF